VDTIYEHTHKFGFGELTGIDIQGESKGLLPSTAWKRAAYRKAEQQKWYAGETISLGIGQGYNAFTMLQLAQAVSTVAAKGLRFPPHLARAVENYDTRESRLLPFAALPSLEWKPEHIAFIHNAYYGVTQEGTSARSFTGAPYKSGGKTGTAQVIEIKANEKYNASKLDERHRDHALYTAFAPLEEPRVALAIVVENAGFGAGAAAPIARRIFDYLLAGKYPSEADIAATQQGQTTAPVGVQRPIDSVPLPGATVDGAATARAGDPAANLPRTAPPPTAAAEAASAPAPEPKPREVALAGRPR
jgi:penicillin-binding protein 2